jgi:hypothetical protein
MSSDDDITQVGKNVSERARREYIEIKKRYIQQWEKEERELQQRIASAEITALHESWARFKRSKETDHSTDFSDVPTRKDLTRI